MDYQSVNEFWFQEAGPEQWFNKDAEFDRLIAERFQATHSAALRGELSVWRDAPEGRLAEVIVLDQFSRNMYRDTPQAFAADPLALILAQEAIRAGASSALPSRQRVFLYMPYMHSESALIHEQAVELFN